MTLEYFTRPYFDELAKLLNNDADFKAKAGNITASMLMLAKDKDRAFIMKVMKGAVSIEDATAASPADFQFIGNYEIWTKNHQGEGTLEKLVMTGKIKFKGSIPKIMSLKNQLGAIDQKARQIAVTY